MTHMDKKNSAAHTIQLKNYIKGNKLFSMYMKYVQINFLYVQFINISAQSRRHLKTKTHKALNYNSLQHTPFIQFNKI